MELEAEGALSGGERRGRALRLAIVASVSCLLLAAAALVSRNANKGSVRDVALPTSTPLQHHGCSPQHHMVQFLRWAVGMNFV